MDSRAFLIDARYIFRFPKFDIPQIGLL